MVGSDGGIARNDVERRPDIVRNIGQEPALGKACVLSLNQCFLQLGLLAQLPADGTVNIADGHDSPAAILGIGDIHHFKLCVLNNAGTHPAVSKEEDTLLVQPSAQYGGGEIMEQPILILGIDVLGNIAGDSGLESRCLPDFFGNLGQKGVIGPDNLNLIRIQVHQVDGKVV